MQVVHTYTRDTQYARTPIYSGENTIEKSLGADTAVSAGPLGGFKDILRFALATSEKIILYGRLRIVKDHHFSITLLRKKMEKN